MPRGRHLLLVVLAVLGGVLAGLGLTAQAAPAEPAVATGCRAPAPTTAAGYQAMFDGKHDDTWAGGDQAASVALPDGRELWLFGDTLRGRRFVHNSALVQDGGCLTALPAADELIPSRADGQWYWPQSAVVLDGRLVVFCGRVERTGDGAFGFRTTGVDAAVFDLSSGTPVFERMTPTPSSDAPETQFQYGAATVREGDELYVWGSRKVAGAFGRQVSVARFRPSSPAAGWQFWDGGAWSRDRAAAAPVADHWSTAFSVWRQGGALHSLTKLDDVYGRTVVTGTASGPTGPFGSRAVLDAPTTDVLRYSALAHPEVRLADGRLLVTVCRNSADLVRVLTTPGLYAPQFSAV